MLARSELQGANEKCQTYWPWCMQRERGDGEEKNADAINLRDKTDPLTRGAQLNFGMIDCLYFSSLYSLPAKEEIEDKSLGCYLTVFSKCRLSLSGAV